MERCPSFVSKPAVRAMIEVLQHTVLSMDQLRGMVDPLLTSGDASALFCIDAATALDHPLLPALYAQVAHVAFVINQQVLALRECRDTSAASLPVRYAYIRASLAHVVLPMVLWAMACGEAAWYDAQQTPGLPQL